MVAGATSKIEPCFARQYFRFTYARIEAEQRQLRARGRAERAHRGGNLGNALRAIALDASFRTQEGNVMASRLGRRILPALRRGSAARASVPPVAASAQAVRADQAGHQEARRHPLVERSVRHRLVSRRDAAGLPAPRCDVRRPARRRHHRAPRNDAEHAAQVGAALGLRDRSGVSNVIPAALNPYLDKMLLDPRPRPLAGHESRVGDDPREPVQLRIEGQVHEPRPRADADDRSGARLFVQVLRVQPQGAFAS